jgi:hypothetical protein
MHRSYETSSPSEGQRGLVRGHRCEAYTIIEMLEAEHSSHFHEPITHRVPNPDELHASFAVRLLAHRE